MAPIMRSQICGLLLAAWLSGSILAQHPEDTEGGPDVDADRLVRRELAGHADGDVIAAVSSSADVSISMTHGEGARTHPKKGRHAEQHTLQPEEEAGSLLEESFEERDTKRLLDEVDQQNKPADFASMIEAARLEIEAQANASSEINPAMAADLAYRAMDILTGTAGIIPEDYPFVCLCGADGVCKNDPMNTKCPMHTGMSGAQKLAGVGVAAVLAPLLMSVRGVL
mmetsp:Transcript_46339/g.110322  ORF Transcript_46339/g.110322 Transcript_46339/m.110322 type:complete len:226 (+) Transcript_46339:64-741(+)